MDKHLPQKHQAHATPGTNGAGPPEEDGMEQASETLMEALSERISFDPENGSIEGCENDFRITQEVLQRHNQQEVAEEVLALLRTQGAYCDCEVLLNSRIDLVFLENDFDEDDDEE